MVRWQRLFRKRFANSLFSPRPCVHLGHHGTASAHSKNTWQNQKCSSFITRKVCVVIRGRPRSFFKPHLIITEHLPTCVCLKDKTGTRREKVKCCRSQISEKNNNLPLLQMRAQFWRYILHIQGELISSWERWRRPCYRKWKKLILRFLPILILYNWNCF